MKTALLSDIHGNLDALNIVLADIEKKSVNQIYCLGDLVDGGKYSDEVVETIKGKAFPTVLGNHDEINDCILKKPNQVWLSQLPDRIVKKNVIFTHISPRIQKKTGICNNIDAWNIFDEVEFRLCFVGHIHFPVIYGNKNEAFGESKTYRHHEGIFQLNHDDRYIISFGAVGYPRKGNITGGNYIRYGIYDSDNETVEFIKLEGPLLAYGSNQ